MSLFRKSLPRISENDVQVLNSGKDISVKADPIFYRESIVISSIVLLLSFINRTKILNWIYFRQSLLFAGFIQTANPGKSFDFQGFAIFCSFILCGWGAEHLNWKRRQAVWYTLFALRILPRVDAWHQCSQRKGRNPRKTVGLSKACVEVLKRHFIGNIRKQAEINQLEIQSLERINELTESKSRINSELKDEKDRLQKIRNERLNSEPSLFD